MRIWILLLAVLGLFFASAPSSLGHGDPPPPPPPPIDPGDYIGAGPGAPPNDLRPRSGPGARSGGGGSRPGSTPRSPSGVPQAMPASAPITGGPSALLDMSSWFYWWEFNKEAFLELRDRLDRDSAFSGSDGFFLGHGHRPRGVHEEGRRPDDAVVAERILPALREALQGNRSNDVIDASLLALARIGNDRSVEERAEIEVLIRPFLRNANGKTARTAVAALGVLGHDPNVFLLGELLLDTQTGRRELDESRVPDATRAFAAYALGLLGHRTGNEDVRRFVVNRLTQALAGDKTGSADLSVACVIALGRVPLAWTGETPERKRGRVVGALSAAASREAQILVLLEILRDGKGDRLVRAHTATSLALLAMTGEAPAEATLPTEVAEELLSALEARRREPRELIQSCVMALGVIGDGDTDELDVRIREALLETISSGSDLSARRFALISLAQATSRERGSEAADPAPVRAALLHRLSRGGSEDRCWASLSLAILERGRAEAKHASSGDVIVALHTALAEARAPSDVGVLAIAAGILRDPEGTDELLEQLETMKEDAARGLVAVGLGLIDAQEASDPIQALVEESTFRPRLLREASIALGLLGDQDLVGILLSKLHTTNSLAARASIAQALGRIGDAESVDPLLEVLGDEKAADALRAYAALALGLVADHDALPWNFIYSANTNYLASSSTLFSGQGFGILNLF
jgi:HEAT repeat protein